MAVYGIDLGTTYSCISKYENNQTTVITNEFDENSTDSAVYFGPNNKVLVGAEAKMYLQTEGHRVIQFAKRKIGKKASPYEIDGKEYNAIEVSSIILKKIIKDASAKGENVKDVVITCPAYFGNEERNATKEAGKLAGLNVLELINEPTAAAISYAYKANDLKSETIVVYDLGGGTFDVTVLDIKVGSDGIPSCTVLASDGDDMLGGKDWDNELYELIKEKIKEDNGLDELSTDDCNNIFAIVEKTKKSLTNKESTTVRVVIDGERMSCDITRSEFEEVTQYLVQKTTDCLDRILSSDNLSKYKISKILLVGGSTHMPMILRTLKECYGDAEKMNKYAGLTDVQYTNSIPICKEDPETAVAKGASIFANMLKKSSSSKPIEIHDIASRTFGVNTWYSGMYYLSNIVYKGEEIPAEQTKTYCPVNDNQEGVLFYIYESIIIDKNKLVPLDINSDTGELNSPDLENDIKYLGKLYLKLPPNAPKETSLYTTMRITASGIKVIVVNSLNNDREEVDIEYNNSRVDYSNSNINALFIE